MYAFLIGAGSTVDLSGSTVMREGPFDAPLWQRMDDEAIVGSSLARVMARFGDAARCGRDALISGEDLDTLAAGCTDGALPRRLPLRHVTTTHAAIRR